MELLNKTINPGASDVLEFNYAGAVAGKLTSFKVFRNEGVLLSITSDSSEAVSFETGKIIIHLSAAETKLLQSVNTDNDLSYSLILMLVDEPHTREVLYTGSILTGAAAPEQVVKIDELFYINKAVRDAQPKMLAAKLFIHNGNPANLHVIRNTTGYNFTAFREDAGIYRIFSDTPCFKTSLLNGFTFNDFTVALQSDSEIDFQGYTLGYIRGNDTILYINLLSPTEGYYDSFFGHIDISILFKD